MTPSHLKNLSDVFQAHDVPAMSDNVETAPDTIAAGFSAMVDEGVLDRRRGKEPRTLSGRTCYAAIARLDNLDIQTAWVMMRFGFRHVTAVTTDGAPMFSAPPRRAPWIHGARRFVLAFRSL